MATDLSAYQASSISELETALQQFIDDCRFAKVVYTSKGQALLIGGVVLQVEQPAWPARSMSVNFVEGVAAALRGEGNNKSVRR